MSDNTGAFYIPAEDKTDDTDFTVPGDQVGETPKGTDNEPQASYHLDRHHSQVAKHYYIHIYNDWDIDMDVGVKGSSFEDEEMDKAMVEQAEQQIASGDVRGFESDTGHSFIEVEFTNLPKMPTTGTLEVVIQVRYR